MLWLLLACVQCCTTWSRINSQGYIMWSYSADCREQQCKHLPNLNLNYQTIKFQSWSSIFSFCTLHNKSKNLTWVGLVHSSTIMMINNSRTLTITGSLNKPLPKINYNPI